MKNVILVLMVIISGYSAMAQQKNISFYKDYYLSKESSESKAKYKKVETKNSDGTVNYQIFDVAQGCMIREENYKDNKPYGVWTNYKKDCTFEKKRDFSKLVYDGNKIDSLFNNVIDNTNSDKYEIAHFGDGEAAIFKYLGTKLEYPSEAKDAGISGTVYLQFIIKPDGKVKMYAIKKSANVFLDYEAWEIIEKMADWIPAKKNGTPIESYFVLPIKFVLK